jgi:hypothetical protein
VGRDGGDLAPGLRRVRGRLPPMSTSLAEVSRPSRLPPLRPPRRPGPAARCATPIRVASYRYVATRGSTRVRWRF